VIISQPRAARNPNSAFSETGRGSNLYAPFSSTGVSKVRLQAETSRERNQKESVR